MAQDYSVQYYPEYKVAGPTCLCHLSGPPCSVRLCPGHANRSTTLPTFCGGAACTAAMADKLSWILHETALIALVWIDVCGKSH